MLADEVIACTRRFFMFKAVKYRDETRLHVISDTSAVFYGTFVICNQDERVIVLKNGELKYTLFGTDLVIAAVTRPKTVIKGKIERIEFN